MGTEATKVTLEFTGASEKLVKRVMLDVVANLVQDTPVDTGWAKANWVPRVGSANETTVGEPGHPDQSTQQRGIADIATRFHMGDTIFVTNNVPYIQALNEGHSPQAPAGYVEAAIQRAIVGASGVTVK